MPDPIIFCVRDRDYRVPNMALVQTRRDPACLCNQRAAARGTTPR